MQPVTASPQTELVLPFYPGDLLRGIKKFRLLLLLVIIAVTAGTLLFCRFQTRYTASATTAVLVRNPLSEAEDYQYLYNWTTASQLSDTMAYAVSGPLMEERICQALDLRELPVKLSVEHAAEANLFTIYATGQDSDTVLRTLPCVLELLPQLTESVIGPARFLILSGPAAAIEPLLPWPAALGTGLALSLLIDAVWILLYAFFRKTVRTSNTIEQELQQTCLGVLPEPSRDSNEHDLAIRQLRGILEHRLSASQQVLVLTGTTYEDEIFRTAGDLAKACSGAGQNVLLITDDKEAALHFWSTDSLEFPTEAVHDPASMAAFLEPLRSKYDRIFLAAPPCAVTADALIFSVAADAVLYLIRQDHAPLHRVRSCLSDLAQLRAPVLGCVLTGVGLGAAGYGQLPRKRKSAVRGGSDS